MPRNIQQHDVHSSQSFPNPGRGSWTRTSCLTYSVDDENEWEDDDPHDDVHKLTMPTTYQFTQSCKLCKCTGLHVLHSMYLHSRPAQCGARWLRTSRTCCILCDILYVHAVAYVGIMRYTALRKSYGFVRPIAMACNTFWVLVGNILVPTSKRVAINIQWSAQAWQHHAMIDAGYQRTAIGWRSR